MIDTQFCKTVLFKLYQHQRSYSVDMFVRPPCPYHRFVHITHGTATFSSANETFHLKAGDILFIPKEIKYRSHWYPDHDSRIQFFLFGFVHMPAESNNRYKLQTLTCNSESKQLLAQLEENIVLSPLSIGIFYHFLGQIFPQLQTDVPSSNEELLDKALEYMRQSDNYLMKDVANHCGLCESSLYAKFRKYLNMTPVEARHGILTEKASVLLSTTDLSVEEISNRLGFSSSSYFRKIFFLQTGKSPSKFRKESRWI